MNDIVCRYRFAKKMHKERLRDVWTSKVNFYLHGVSFYYKRNPVGQAKAPWAKYGGQKGGSDRAMHSEGEKRGVGEEFLTCLWLLATTKGLYLAIVTKS